MEVVIGILVVLIIILCVLMVASILLQEDKTGGGIGIVGGSSQSFFGANSSSFLSRITTVFVVLFFLLTIVCAILAASFSKDKMPTLEDIIQAEATGYTSTNMLKTLPVSITADDFDSSILFKIDDERDKALLNKFYEKSSDGKLYALKDKILRDDRNTLLSILNSIGYTQEAKRTIIKEETVETEIVE